MVAFVRLNSAKDEVGDALILRSIRHAQGTMEAMTMIRDDETREATMRGHDLCENDMTAAITAILLRDAVRQGKLLPREEQVMGLFGEAIARRVELSALEHTKGEFHAAVRAALERSDGWSAALLLEARGDLLCDEGDFRLCDEACEWCDRSGGTVRLRRMLDGQRSRLGFPRKAHPLVSEPPRQLVSVPRRVPVATMIAEPLDDSPEQSDGDGAEVDDGKQALREKPRARRIGELDKMPPFGGFPVGIPVAEIALLVVIAYGAST